MKVTLLLYAGHPTTFLTSCHLETTGGQMCGIWDALGRNKPKKTEGTAHPSSCFATEGTQELSQTSLGDRPFTKFCTDQTALLAELDQALA